MNFSLLYSHINHTLERPDTPARAAMGADSSLRADEVALLEKLEAKRRGQLNKVQYKRRMTFRLAHKSPRFDAFGLTNESGNAFWHHI
jgi:hypothetical protein